MIKFLRQLFCRHEEWVLCKNIKTNKLGKACLNCGRHKWKK